MYEKSSAEASVSLIMPKRSIFDEDVSKHMLIGKMPLCRF